MAGGIRDIAGDDLPDNHEINVTPFIDVMLVLLIIFMVAAPLATVDVNVDLPVSNATPAQRPDHPVYVTVKPDLTLALGNEDIPAGTLAEVLARATNAPAGTVAQLTASQLSNAVKTVPAAPAGAGEPVVASIYQLDGLVRRSTSLQLTADARMAHEGVSA